MTDTDSFAKAMMSPMMEQGQERKKKVEENKLNQSTENGAVAGNATENQPVEYNSQKDADEQKGQTVPQEDSTPQKDDDDNDMSLVDEARGAGLGVNTKGLDSATLTRDELDKKYSEMAAEIGEKAQARRDATPKAKEQTEEKRAHNDEISRLENEYRTSMNEDDTAAMERVGAKEVLEVPNYREHVTDDQMQGWGRALASFGSVGLKEGANAIDAATKTLGEFRKLTRAFLSPNPMSPISQAVASTMVGFNTMYDAIDRAGEIAGIKQGADKSIVMETARGAQYYKDKDNATRVANYIMQTFNDQIRDTLGPGGDVTQLNPAQFTRIYGKMKEGFFDSEIERIKHKYSTGQPLSLEDKAIVNGWDNLNKNYHKVLKDKEKTAKEYAKEIGGHERAINALDRQYGKDVRAYDKVIAGIDKDEFNQQRSLGADYTRDLKDLGGRNRTVDAWKAGFDDAVRNKDQVGALIRMTLGPEANRRLRNGNVLLETLKGAQDQANSNATNPNFTPEQQEKWLKIASVFGKRVQTVRNMSVEQRKQYALRLSGAPKTEKKGSKGRSSGGKTLTYTPLMSTRDMQVALNKTPTAYVADKLSDWMGDHRYSVYWGGSKAKENLYNAAKDMLKDLYGREYKAYRELGTDKLSGEDLEARRAELKGLYNKIKDVEDKLEQPATGYLTPHAFGDKLRKLDTQKERDDFIGNALEEAGVWVINPKSKKGYRADMDKLKGFLELETENMARDPEAFDALFTALSRYQWGPRGRKILNGYRDRVTDMLQSMWNFEGTENPAPEEEGAGAGDGPKDEDRTEDKNSPGGRGGSGGGDGPGGQGDDQEKGQGSYQGEVYTKPVNRETAGYQAGGLDETPVDASAGEGGESAGPVVTQHDSSNYTKMKNNQKYGVEYNSGAFEKVVNDNTLSLEEKIKGIDEILQRVNTSLDMEDFSEATKDKLRHLQDRLNTQRDVYTKEDTAEFERYQQNKNAENLADAYNGGSNPYPSGDLRRTDSWELFKKLPEGGNYGEEDYNIEPEVSPAKLSREEKTRKITEMIEGTFGKKGILFRGVSPRYLDLNDEGKISWDGQAGQVIPGKLKEVEDKLDAIDDWAGSEKTRGNPQVYRDKAEKILIDIAKKVKFIEENFAEMGENSPVKKQMRDLKIAMKTAYRFVYAHNPEKLGDLKPRFTARESAGKV